MEPYPTLVHDFSMISPDCAAYESGNFNAQNALVLIGGLGDGPHKLPYARALSKVLSENPGLGYSLFEVHLKSSHMMFGFSSLAEDTDGIEKIVGYLRGRGRNKIVLMGHSTGCQDIMEYNVRKASTSPVTGYILQAPVSDRQNAWLVTVAGKSEEEEKLKKALETARCMIDEGRPFEWVPKDVIPTEMADAPYTAYRFNALYAEGGDDDYFSSDLPEGRVAEIWSGMKTPTLILISGADQYMPSSIDKSALLSSWTTHTPHNSAFSGVIPSATHAVPEATAQETLFRHVISFLTSV